eukprot:CAMPEP_0172483968 /NCGR_PEP_ID=MMETSP1066-20121228/11218_1 /TAXON_ID=671091 /ORGANISM="Coscinodiscus wailesii, Strain CCMP2513" /LENGTH=114 /DNA_ID=CAMNT_0013248189 /DNA_START=157 /DNA_END=498 /DNA_ORIENTATION=+
MVLTGFSEELAENKTRQKRVTGEREKMRKNQSQSAQAMGQNPTVPMKYVTVLPSSKSIYSSLTCNSSVALWEAATTSIETTPTPTGYNNKNGNSLKCDNTVKAERPVKKQIQQR